MAAQTVLKRQVVVELLFLSNIANAILCFCAPHFLVIIRFAGIDIFLTNI